MKDFHEAEAILAEADVIHSAAVVAEAVSRAVGVPVTPDSTLAELSAICAGAPIRSNGSR